MSASSSALWRFLYRGCVFPCRRRAIPRRISRLCFAERSVFTGDWGALLARCSTSMASCSSAAARSDALLLFFMTVLEPGRACERARVHYLLYFTLSVLWTCRAVPPSPAQVPSAARAKSGPAFEGPAPSSCDERRLSVV